MEKSEISELIGDFTVTGDGNDVDAPIDEVNGDLAPIDEQDAPINNEPPVQGELDLEPASAPTPTPIPTNEPSDPKDAEITQLREIITNLQRQIEQVAGQATLSRTPEPAPAPANEPASEFKYVSSEEEFDKMLNTADNFNKFMGGVEKRIVESATESILRSIPVLVSKVADESVVRRMAVAEFYSANKDLVNNKAFVGMVANEMAQLHPEWTLDQVISELGPEVRKRLNLVTNAPASEPVQKPAFVPGVSRGGRRSAPSSQVSALQKELNDLIKD